MFLAVQYLEDSELLCVIHYAKSAIASAGIITAKPSEAQVSYQRYIVSMEAYLSLGAR